MSYKNSFCVLFKLNEANLVPARTSRIFAATAMTSFTISSPFFAGASLSVSIIVYFKTKDFFIIITKLPIEKSSLNKATYIFHDDDYGLCLCCL